MNPTTTNPTTEEPKPRKPHKAFFEIAQDEDKKWHWCLWSGNGRQIAMNAEPYDTKKHCIQAIKLIAPNVNDADLILKDSSE